MNGAELSPKLRPTHGEGAVGPPARPVRPARALFVPNADGATPDLPADLTGLLYSQLDPEAADLVADTRKELGRHEALLPRFPNHFPVPFPALR